jgi:hypothetical protein
VVVGETRENKQRRTWPTYKRSREQNKEIKEKKIKPTRVTEYL